MKLLIFINRSRLKVFEKFFLKVFYETFDFQEARVSVVSVRSPGGLQTITISSYILNLLQKMTIMGMLMSLDVDVLSHVLSGPLHLIY